MPGKRSLITYLQQGADVGQLLKKSFDKGKVWRAARMFTSVSPDFQLFPFSQENGPEEDEHHGVFTRRQPMHFEKQGRGPAIVIFPLDPGPSAAHGAIRKLKRQSESSSLHRPDGPAPIQ